MPQRGVGTVLFSRAQSSVFPKMNGMKTAPPGLWVKGVKLVEFETLRIVLNSWYFSHLVDHFAGVCSRVLPSEEHKKAGLLAVFPPPSFG